MRQNNQSNRKTVARKARVEMISHPPQLDGYQVTHSVTLRFTTSAAVEQAITFQNLLDSWIVAQSAVVGSDLFNWVKIRRLRMWASPLLGTSVTLAAAFAGVTAGVVGDGIQHTDTSMGVQPACVDCRPSRKSLASEYQNTSAAQAFTLNVPAGTVIDLSLTFKGAFAVATAAQNALVGATPGGIYLRGLDGLAVATTKFPVVTLADANNAI